MLVAVVRHDVYKTQNKQLAFPQVWLLVQRKWIYLESIFIGGDIRAQLPGEAKKFDVIDKKFKDVSVSITFAP